MAARLLPERVHGMHHRVAKATWPDQTMVTAVQALMLPDIEQHRGINAWIADDTDFSKKGM